MGCQIQSDDERCYVDSLRAMGQAYSLTKDVNPRAYDTLRAYMRMTYRVEPEW